MFTMPLRRLARAARLRALSVAAATSIVVWASSATAGPSYFGYFGNAMYERGTGDYINAIKDHANLSWIDDGFCGTPSCGCVLAPGDPPQNGASWLTTKLAETQAAGMKAEVAVVNVFFPTAVSGGFHYADVTARFDPDPTINDAIRRQRWNAFKCQIAPYLSSIVAFSLADEPPNWTLPDLEAIARDYLKADYPAVHRNILFSALQMEEGNFFLPPDLDWVGYDCYPGTFEQCYPDPRYQSVPYYLQVLKRAMRAVTPRPQIVLVPQAWQTSTFAASPNTQFDTLRRAEREIEMAETDPDVAVVMPFLWQDVPAGALYGAENLPAVRAFYKKVGQHLLTGAPRLAFPDQITASSTLAGSSPFNMVDVDSTTLWSSGGYPPAAIHFGYADPIRIVGGGLITAQSPAGQTQHNIIGGYRSDPPVNLRTFSGFTADNELLAWTASGTFSSIDISTDIVPSWQGSWVGWREGYVYTDGGTRLFAEPIAASQTYPDSSMLFAADGNDATLWSAGGYAPQSITFDLGSTRTVRAIELVVAQSPAGNTRHQIYGGPSALALSHRATVEGFTADGSVCAVQGPFPGVRLLQVSTDDIGQSDPSWVGWRDVRIYVDP